MHKFLIPFFLVLFPFCSFAGIIKGSVTEDKNGSPLIGVVVSVKSVDTAGNDKSTGTVTDFDGNFEVTGLKGGTYEVTFTYMTFNTETASVTLTEKDERVLQIRMKPETKELKEVAIKANKITHTDIALVSEIRNSTSVVSGISASQITKTLDRNAADVVKRVPGVTIRDDKFIIVRGLPDRYNTVWLNDAGTPSSETDKKSFSFDIIPSGLIDRVLIFKSPSPELPGDFAGGMVKVYTTSIQEKNELNVQFQVSSREYTTGKNYQFNKPSSTDWLGYDDGGRNIPDAAAGLNRIRKSDPNIKAITKAFGNDWAIDQKNASPDMRFAMSTFNNWKFKKFRLGNTFGLSYSNTYNNYDVTRRQWENNDLVYKYGDRQYSNNVMVGLMDNVGLIVGNSKIEFKNIYSQVGRSSVTTRRTLADTLLDAQANERAYSMGYDSRANFLSQLTGTHKNNDDSRKYTWTLGYSDLFKNQPNLRRISYSRDDNRPDSPYYAPITTQVDILNGGGRYYSSLYEHIYSFSHQFTQKVNVTKKYSFDVSVGNYFEYRDRSLNIRQLGYTIANGASKDTLNYRDINTIFADSNVGRTGGYLMDETTNKYDKYNAQNRLLAGFVMVKAPIGSHLSVSGGVRYEDNTQSIQTFVNQDSVDININTQYFLPSVNLTYNFTQSSMLRGGYGVTLNRPEFREWAPVYFYNFDEIAGTNGSLYPNAIKKNNQGDTLEVSKIQNFDLRYEFYPSQGEMIQVGGFYKTFQNPILRAIIPGGSGGGKDKNFTFINGKDAFCYGFELDVRKNLGFLDSKIGSNFLKDLTLIGNFALTKSEITIDTSTFLKQIEKSTIQGQSPYVINAGLYYQNLKNGYQGSLLYNVFGSRMYAVGTQNIGEGSIGELPFQSLDLSISKQFKKHYIISFGIQNILNAKVRFYQDINNDNKFDTKEDKDQISYRPGSYYTLGVRIKI